MVHAPDVRASPIFRVALGVAVLCITGSSSARAAAPAPASGDVAQPPDAAAPDAAPSEPESAPAASPRPPRLSGPYLGLSLMGTVTGARVNSFGTDSPFAGGGGFLRFGQFVLPWLGIGLSVGGTGGNASGEDARQGLGQGALLVDFEFVPAPTRVQGLSLRTSFGFGGGAVTEEGVDARSGYGGAVFAAGARYTFFPGAQRYRATKAGGFGLGPEIGWLGFTPAAKGRPMSNSLYVGASLAFYFGD